MIRKLVSRSSLAYWMMTTLSMVFVGAYAADSVLDATSASAALPGEGADGARHVAIRGDAERRSIDRIALVTRMAPITLVSTAVRACREVGALWAAAASRHPTLPRRQPSRRGTGCPAGTVAAWRRGSRGYFVAVAEELHLGRPPTGSGSRVAVVGDPAARTAARRGAAGAHQPHRHADRGRVGAAAA